MQAAEQRQDLVADQAPRRVRVRGVRAVLQPRGAAVRLRLVAPEVEERAHNAVGAAALDRARLAARNELIERGLDLVRGSVAGGAEAPALGAAVADLAQRGLR